MKKQKFEKEETLYSVMPDGMEIISKLVKRYPDILWAVQPENILILGITNKERSKSNKKLATITRPSGVIKAAFEFYNIKIKYIIQVYYSDWVNWSEARRAAIIFHETLHVPSPTQDSGLVEHDVQDFRILTSVMGVNWPNLENIPSLLEGDLVQFDKNLMPTLPSIIDPEEITKEDTATIGGE